MASFKAGDRIAYSRAFVRLCGNDKGAGDRRGTVVCLAYPVRGASGDKGWYRVRWDDSPGEAGVILSTNIVHVDALHKEPA